MLVSAALFGLNACSNANNSTDLTPAQTPAVSENQTKPNVILIYADDISAREFSIYQSKKWSGFRGKTVSDPEKLAEIPVISEIANQGMFVENAWAATVCSPSRAMLMTGRYANLHKWWHNKDYGLVTDEKTGQKRPVRLYETSPFQIGQLANTSGYQSIWVGKTQMGHTDGFENYGFDEGVFTPGLKYPDLSPYTTFGVQAKKVDGVRVLYNVDSGKSIEGFSYVQQGWYWKPNVELFNHPSAKSELEYWPNTSESKEKFGVNTFGPDVELDFIFDFIDRQHSQNKPFFVYHTTHLGHDAFDFLQPESKDKWPGTPIVNWDGEKYTRVKPNITGEKGQYNLNGTVTDPGMHNHVKYLDYQIWLYLEKLKKLQIQNDTILIIAADNGTSGYGKHSHVKQQGTHVPFIVYAPGQQMTKKGKQPIIASMADILPTLADIMGSEIPQGYEINGKSLWPFLTTDAKTHREWIYAYKKDKTLIRGNYVMKDGNDNWWNVTTTPDDLDSFEKINDWSKVSEQAKKERDKLNAVIPQFDVYETAHDPDSI
ncbi:sulfatase-like hydrolase/transferase [Catenovulum adriaticum]|uniref:Sulfatase-like hydrolase/transferase n=1 Tax=Catenovulum adriaticum TaxID=2984846 RepID=A0ABY7ASX3_9ALTE|nr:sulfatase-like hydrolase/transferase [Catenovulum sp. TS8]WAJ71877.1 sulfatase-like hydrolase/transferase [Catenovulum sp. TS8]